MPSARKSRDSNVAWPLFQAIVIWFLLGLAASRLAIFYGTSPLPFALCFSIGLVAHVVMISLRVALIHGPSAKLRLSVVAGFLLAGGMFATLRETENRFIDTIMDPLMPAEQKAYRAFVNVDETFKRILPPQNLAAANNLVFAKGTQRQALDEALQHLRSIPPSAGEYKSAQALLQVAEMRLRQLQADVHDAAKVPIEIVGLDRSDNSLRVTFRNIGQKTVRRLRYSISYFRVADGWHVEPDSQSEIVAAIRPRETRTIEIHDDVLTGGAFYVSLSVMGWEAVPVL